MNPKKWNIFLSLQGNNEDAPEPSKDIVPTLEQTEQSLYKYNIFNFFDEYQYKNILVVGAGCGNEVLLFLRRGYIARGTTLHNSDKKYAKNQYNIDLILTDMHNMNFQSELFDGIFTNHTLEHSISPLIALFEFRRVLKSNGKLMIIVPNVDTENETGLQHYSVFRKQLWNHLLNLVGFNIIESEVVGENILIKAVKSDKDCPAKHFEKELKKYNLYNPLIISNTNNQIYIESNIMNNDSNIEIIGISTCGTYPSWLDYTLASFYNHVDKIIVVNAGYDIYNPELGAIHPLEREHKLIEKIDIHNKITEYIPSRNNINQIFETTCKKNKDEEGRSTNMTLATQFAYKQFNTSKPHFILKLDSDQILHQITRFSLETLLLNYPTKTGFRFAQYPDYYHDFKHIGNLPDEFTNDGALFHKSIPNQGYCGQGSPGYIHVDQQPIYNIRTSHMRRINPSDVDPYEYHFKRLWYHTYAPNSIMELDYNRKNNKKLTNDEILEIAHKQAISILQDKGKEINIQPYDIRVPYSPPLVCQMTPLEYIEKGY